MIRLFINDIEYPYEDKISLNLSYNETLDSAVVIIPNSNELPIKRLDRVYFKEDEEIVKYYLVGTIVKEFETFEEPFKYKYTLNLCSPTLILQNVILPNISITQPLTNDGSFYSIFDEVKRLVDVFAPQLTISNKFRYATQNIKCPELQFNRKTLYEIINTLLVNVPAVVTMEGYDSISLLNLANEGSEIYRGLITNIVETQKLDEYCTEVEMSAENVVEGRANTYSVRGITPRSQDYALTTDNCQIILDKPIYKLEKVECYASGYPTSISWGSSPTGVVEGIIGFTDVPIDITKYILEDTVYNTKYPYNREINFLKDGKRDKSVYNYKRCFLSYTQGSNIIDNLSFREKNLVGWNIKQIALECALRLGALDYADTQLPEGKFYISFSGDSNDKPSHMGDPRRTVFNITYTSESGIRFRVKKTGAELMNEKVLIDSQDNSYVDSQALYKAERENVNRLGNPELTITMAVDRFSQLPQYRARFGDYVLTEGSSLIYANKMFFQGTFTKNFIRKNLYTGIKSKARFTSIAKADEALARQDLIQITHKLSLADEAQGYNYLFDKYIFENLGENRDNISLVVGTARNQGASTSIFDLYNGYYKVGTSRYVLGDSNIICFNFKDNYAVGMQISQIYDSVAYSLSQVEYVDSNGEAEYLRLMFVKDNTDITTENLWVESQKLPSLTDTSFDPSLSLSYNQFLIKKDNREIYGADIQMRFKGDSNDIIIFDEFANQSPLVFGAKKGIYFFGRNDKIITPETNKLPNLPSVVKVAYDRSLITNTYIERPTFEPIIEGSLKSWGICNEDGEILIGVNSKNKKLYFRKEETKLC